MSSEYFVKVLHLVMRHTNRVSLGMRLVDTVFPEGCSCFEGRMITSTDRIQWVLLNAGSNEAEIPLGNYELFPRGYKCGKFMNSSKIVGYTDIR